MKRCPLLLLAAPFILCSIKSDVTQSATRQEATQIINQPASPFSVLALTYNWTHMVMVGSTTYGYFPLGLAATFNYYTYYFPQRNTITSVTMPHFAFTHTNSGSGYTNYMTYTPISQSYTTPVPAINATLTYVGTVTFEKRVTATNQLISTTSYEHTTVQTVNASTFPFEYPE
jgi:hypothetical protein